MEKSRSLGKGLVFEASKTGAWKVTILDRLDFDLGQKSTVFEHNTFHLQNQLCDARFLRTPPGLDWYLNFLSS
jgi:hypothetical protein